MQTYPADSPQYTLKGLLSTLHDLSGWFQQKKKTGKKKYIEIFHKHLHNLCEVFVNELVDEFLAGKIYFKEGDVYDPSVPKRNFMIPNPSNDTDLLLNETLDLEKATLKYYDSMIDEGNLSFRTSAVLEKQRAILIMSLKEIIDLEIKYKCSI